MTNPDYSSVDTVILSEAKNLRRLEDEILRFAQDDTCALRFFTILQNSRSSNELRQNLTVS